MVRYSGACFRRPESGIQTRQTLTYCGRRMVFPLGSTFASPPRLPGGLPRYRERRRCRRRSRHHLPAPAAPGRSSQRCHFLLLTPHSPSVAPVSRPERGHTEKAPGQGAHPGTAQAGPLHGSLLRRAVERSGSPGNTVAQEAKEPLGTEGFHDETLVLRHCHLFFQLFGERVR